MKPQTQLHGQVIPPRSRRLRAFWGRGEFDFGTCTSELAQSRSRVGRLGMTCWGKLPSTGASLRRLQILLAMSSVAFGERINTSTSRRASLLLLCVCPPPAVHLNQSPSCSRTRKNSVTSAPCSSPVEKHSCLPYGWAEMLTTARSWLKCWPPEKEKCCSPTLLIRDLSLPTISFSVVGQIS